MANVVHGTRNRRRNAMKWQTRSTSRAAGLLAVAVFLFATLAGLSFPRSAAASTAYSSLSYQMQVQFTYVAKYSSNGLTESVTTTSKYTFTATLDKSYGGTSLGCTSYPCTSVQGTYTSNYAWSSNSGCPSTFTATGTYQLNMSAGWDIYSGNVTLSPSLAVKPETASGVYAYCFFVGGSNELNSYIVYDVMYSCYSLLDPNSVTAASTKSCTNFPVQGGSRTLSAGPEASADWITSLTGSVQLTLLSSTTTTTSSSTSTGPTQTTTKTTSTTTTKPTTCPTMYLTEGLAPAATRSNDDNVYITVYWGGQTPVSVEFGAFPQSPAITTDFAFNPVQMMSSTVSVLMNVYTANAQDGNYIINVAAQVTDPQSGQPCNAGIKAFVTVTSGSVFVGTPGNLQAEAIWVKGLSSPFLVSGQINASWYSQFVPTLDSNGYLSALAFTLTGTDGSGPQQGVLTIPKVLVAPGFTPAMTINGVPLPLDRFSQDATNFYVTYTATFSTHRLVLSFLQQGASTSSSTSSESASSIVASNSSGVSRTTVISGVLPSNIIELGVGGAFLVVVIALVALALRRTGRRKTSSPASQGVQPQPATTSGAHRAPESRKTCPKCGTANDPQDAFCVNCGADMN
jgi:hypothetical protein